jgi:pyruvate/2-oxoglutarate dehydrogenase complex dihydrolipoamide acyltransferase (E2) component
MGYRYDAKNRFFEANRSIVEYEIRPGNTVTFISEVDLTQIEQIRTEAGEQRPSYTAFVAKAVALALKELPYANRRVCRRVWWLPLFGKCLQAFDTCDVAVAAERDIPGIEYCAFADIIRDADKLPLTEINRWLHDLATCDINTNKQWHDFSTIISRVPRLLATFLIRLPVFVPAMWAQYRGGAVLISSPAKYGVDSVTTTWTWPLGLSFGYVKERPIVKDGKVTACTTFNLVLNFDRRVMAGAQGARFFKRMVDILTNAKSEMTAYLP